MKTRLSILLLLGFFSFQLKAQESGINFFEGTWQEAQVKAQKEHKLIFLDCYTTWCGPCKNLANTVFIQKKMGDYYNANFINVSMDMEKGIGPEICIQYDIKAYPTLLFIKPSGGYLVNKAVGFKDADTLLICAKAAVNHSDSMTIDERFYKGPRDEAFLREYMRYMVTHKSHDAFKIALDTIIKQEGYEAFYQKKYWEMLAMTNINSPLGLWFVANKEKFYGLFGEDQVRGKIAEMYLNYSLIRTIQETSSRDTSLLSKFQKTCEVRNLPDVDFMKMGVDFYVYCKNGNMDEAFKIANSALTDNKGWKYHIIARLADWMTVGLTEYRFQAAKWAAKAAVLMKNDKAKQQECLLIADDLLNEIIPRVYPSPKVYGIDM